MTTPAQAPRTLNALEETGRVLSETTQALEEQFDKRKTLFRRGYEVGVEAKVIAHAAGVSPTFIRASLGSAPALGAGSIDDQIEVLTELKEAASAIKDLQEKKQELRLAVEGLIASRLKGGKASTTDALAQESGMSTATVNRIRKKLKST
jgi:small ligand-binding sensory domain FIST